MTLFLVLQDNTLFRNRTLSSIGRFSSFNKAGQRPSHGKTPRPEEKAVYLKD